MVSISSVSEIKKRALKFFNDIKDAKDFNEVHVELLKKFLLNEITLIPQKERIGKGQVYVLKIVAREFYKHFLDGENIENVLKIIHFFEDYDELLLFAVHLGVQVSKHDIYSILDDLIKWITHDDWEVRENACHVVRSALKSAPKKTLELLEKWSFSECDKVRRAVAESLRPLASLKWLRNKGENEPVLKILTRLNHDPSIYVRKAVGNNLKDLTKYMPETVLDLIESWLNKKELLDEKGKKNLIWTVYQALRWLKNKKPEYHDRIERLVGKNYILYFDEKRNRWAIPR
ncbi:MAG: DNA alkylation repair protein [Promethearchaeota archaeon]